MSAGAYRATLAVVGVVMSFVGFDMVEKGRGGGLFLVSGLVLVASALPLTRKEG
jgi:anaerobic glycerol-3-phosphate dehydrogenase